MSGKKLPVLGGSTAPRTGSTVADALQGATSHDLVFAVVGHTGAGASWICQLLQEALENSQHRVQQLKMSTLIEEAARRNHPEFLDDIGSKDRLTRTTALQNAGNLLRKTHGAAFTAGLAIRQMHHERSQQRDDTRPLVFIIDSLKNPAEVDALRKVYGSSFYLISVVCGPDKRLSRLKIKYKPASRKKQSDEALDALMQRDEAEKDGSGQQVRKTIQLGDFFINNEVENGQKDTYVVDDELKRFIQAVFATEIIRPTREERGMYAAWTVALRSSCLSRQVGAAILDGNGQLIATGTNEVPTFGGGLYEGDTHAQGDHRCFANGGYCRNDRAKKEILADIVKGLMSANLLRDGITDDVVLGALGDTPIKDLIEFSRAVHAEMDALVSLARTGGSTSMGASMYCTTYPCHNCARHIVAAGIREVVYIEPYTKSRAIELHRDAIVEATSAHPIIRLMCTFACSPVWRHAGMQPCSKSPQS